MKTTKELLELMLANPDEFRNGMCSWIMSLYFQNLISDGEYELIQDYITRNRPSIRYPRYFNIVYCFDAYYWPIGKIKPRIKWIKYHIKKLSE